MKSPLPATCVARRIAPACAFLAGLLLAMQLLADDWPQYRGPRRDGITTEKIATTWPASGPREIWRAQVGRGHAAVSIADGRAYTLGYTGHGDPLTFDPAQGDTVRCFDAVTGQELWKFDYAAVARIKGEPGNGGYDGPHATPLVVKDRVYTLSRDGKVHCLDAVKGTPIWNRDLVADDGAKFPECGFAGSPLALGDKIIVSVGVAGTALDAATGQTRWKSSPEIAGYAAPSLVTDAKGTSRLLFFGYKALIAVNPADGQELWSFPWPTKSGANATDPVAIGDSVFISAAYDRGCALVELETGRPRYQAQTLTSHCTAPILRDGALFGFSGFINDIPKDQSLVCLDPLTGTEFWRQAKMAGQMILANDKLVILLTNGELVILRANAKAYEELAHRRIVERQECPIPPVLASGRLYVRTSKGLLTCLDMAP